MVGQIALGKYRLLQSLGSGSNGEVYYAEPIQFPEFRVVVKRIHDHVVKHPKFRQRFEAEVQSMANFDHPYAVGLIEAALDDPLGPCLVMEYVPGMTLEALLGKYRRLTPERVGLLLGYFCHALEAAHQAGIVHRDLKPANLMVVKPTSPDEFLKVMDFGFAGFVAKPYLQLADLTGQGPIDAMGTPSYVSPEMIRGDRVDARSDLYSVGVILYEMLTGRLPFVYEYQDRLLMAHLKDAPPRFMTIGCRDIPPEIEAVVLHALSKYPNERPQSAKELLDEYSRALGVDLWEATFPAGWEPTAVPLEPVALEAPRRHSQSPFQVFYELGVLLPERMAAAKLRGFIDDLAAEVVTTEPGLIRLRLGLPAGYKEGQSSGILGWFATRRPSVPKGQEPIEVELHMDRPDPSQPLLNVLLSFQPLKDYPPQDAAAWYSRCEKVHTLLKRYLGA
ncbi:MAG: serine/threonine-protein kinase [Gemmataceae bacterium]|nr:serine/threonine protein kinase [Gemmata sp.]MDW8196328.1 serine/threonine-protein kinase [Gemmataceae bacterium]